MKPFAADIRVPGQGLDQYAPPGEFAWSELENFLPFSGRLLERQGSAQLTTNPYTETLQSLMTLKPTGGAVVIIVGTAGGFARVDGPSLVAIPRFGGGSYPSSTRPWVMRRYKGTGWAARPSAGTLKRVTQDVSMDAGIPAPTTVATIADGGAGSMTAGDYLLVYTYLNSEGDEGDFSPPSAKLTLAANKRITASAVKVSSNPQVSRRNLYLTLPNQTGQYWFVKQVADNFTEDGIDINVPDVDFGARAPFDHGLPPAIVKGVEIWNERAWVHDGETLFFSQPGNMQAYGVLDFLLVKPDDHLPMNVLRAWADRLCVGKLLGVHVVRGTSSGRFEVETLSDEVGNRGDAMRSVEGLLLWYGGDNFYRSEGIGAQSISTTKIRDILDAVPEAQKDQVVGEIFPRYSSYVVAVPQGESTPNTKVLAYNYKTGEWTSLKFAMTVAGKGGVQIPSAPVFMSHEFDASNNDLFLALFHDQLVWELDTGSTDAGAVFTARAKSSPFGDPVSGRSRALRRAAVLTPAMAGQTLTARIYNDGASSAIASRSGISLARPGWKWFDLNSIGEAASRIQLELEYSGTARMQIEGIDLEGMQYDRRGPIQ